MRQDYKNEDSQYTVSVLEAEGLVACLFYENEKASGLLDFLSSIIPVLDGEYPKVEDSRVLMTREQYHFYRLYLSQLNEDFLFEIIADHYFLKTLRSDAFDFSHAFIKGIIPGEKTRRLQNLRPSERKRFVITPSGEVVDRLTKAPLTPPSVKEHYSQIQSCTFIDMQAKSRAFGFSKEREGRLYGLMTHENDVMVHRALVKDSGTISRVFEFEDECFAKTSLFFDGGKSEKVMFSQDQFAEFKSGNLRAKEGGRFTNEVLARMRFNPYRSVVCICSDTLEARLLGYHFSQELLQEFKEYAHRNNIAINTNYKIPIIFYLPHNHNREDVPYNHDIKYYTETMQEKDQEEAYAILNNNVEKNKRYDSLNCEFLLGLDKITSEHLLDIGSKAQSLAERLLRAKSGRLLLRLFESRNTCKSEVITEVFYGLVKNGRIQENDEIISELIKIEAFDIANSLLVMTNSNKYLLKLGSQSLTEWMINLGNPRHMDFMGLDVMIPLAVQKNSWAIIKLCLKEQPKAVLESLTDLLLQCNNNIRYCRQDLNNQLTIFITYLLTRGKSAHLNFKGIDKVLVRSAEQNQWEIIQGYIKENPIIDPKLLSILLVQASDQGDSDKVEFILREAASSSIELNVKKALVTSTKRGDWKTVLVFSQFPTDEVDSFEYGFAVLEAVRNKEVVVAQKLIDAGAKPKSTDFFGSTLYLAVEHRLNQLLPRLIHFESQCEHTPAFYSRCFLARDLAYVNSNVVAARLIDKLIAHQSPFGTSNNTLGIARLFIQAMYLENKRLAMYRLMRYMGDNNPVRGLTLILASIEDVYPELPDHCLDAVKIRFINCLLDCLVSNNALEGIIALFQSGGPHPLFHSSLFYKMLLNRITPELFGTFSELSKEIKSDLDRSTEWQSVLDKVFHLAIKNVEAEKADLLLRLGATPNHTCAPGCCGLAVLDMASFDGNEAVVDYLLSHFKFDQELIQRSLLRAVSSNRVTNIPRLLLNRGAQISPDVICAATSKNEALIDTLINHLDLTTLESTEYSLAAFSLWCSAYNKLDLQQKLSVVFDSARIMHYVLIQIHAILCVSLDNKDYNNLRNLHDIRNPKRKLHFFWIFSKNNCGTNEIYDANKVKFSISNSVYEIDELLIILCDYFALQKQVLNELPNYKCIVQTYQAVKEVVNKIASTPKNVVSSICVRFFSTVGCAKFITSVRAHMREVDTLLVQKAQQHAGTLNDLESAVVRTCHQESSEVIDNYRQLVYGRVY